VYIPTPPLSLQWIVSIDCRKYDSPITLIGTLERAFWMLLLLLCVHTSAFPMASNLDTLVARANKVNDASGELWAAVIANVAPLMALVGERNAKDYMRVASSRTQLAIMASAPLGVLSILVSAVRLSGPRFLRRLLGRESDRKSEALVELTPLSVEPATSSYTAEGVEIEPTFNRDRVAFVCGHIKHTNNVDEAVRAFKQLMLARNGKVDASRDFEAVLALYGLDLSLEETAQFVTSIVTEHSTKDIDRGLVTHGSSASLSFRTTGISPSQTTLSSSTWYRSFQRVTNVLVASCFCCFMICIQILPFYIKRQSNTSTLQTLLMGVVGYMGVATCSFMLLVLLKGEVHVEPQEISDLFSQAIWTISDARHAEHRLITMPAKASLAIARPARFTARQKRNREKITFILTLALVGSYVIYYLGLRAASWWVGLSHVGFIWLAAAYRATITKNILVAQDGDVGEHWLGIFRDTLYDSLVEMTRVLEHNSKAPEMASTSVSLSPHPDAIPTISREPPHGNCSRLLVSAKPIRQSLRNWSGCEDVMKVALELAKRVCRERTSIIPYVAISTPHLDSIPGGKLTSWGGVFRFRLMIYVPGLVWIAQEPIDYVRTEQEFDMPNLYRDIFKIIHLCSDYTGDTSFHELSDLERRQLSDTLCGPIHRFDKTEVASGMTLSQFLMFLRNAGSIAMPGPKAYSLEQAILLPTIQLAVMYESTRNSTDSVIETYQNQHIDKLALSGGGKWLQVLNNVLDKEKIWSEIVAPGKMNSESQPVGRDVHSGLYRGGFGNNRESQWLHRDRIGVESDRNVVEFRLERSPNCRLEV
jgi:hypothetical protein